MRFVHTADWQIGKTFGFADDASQVLRDERLDAITRIGELARSQAAFDVLVAGDVFEVETPSDRTLRQPIERMRAFEGVRWHLVPGNHDPHTPSGPWERQLRIAKREQFPPNVHIHLTPEPVPIADGSACLLPSVLTRRHAANDPTAWMDETGTPVGAARIGLAHGSIASFGNDAADTPNRIAPDRPTRAGLAYLALGDWHGERVISDRCRYAGTPEIDDFSVVGGGVALVVDIESAHAPPVVTAHRIGRFCWHKLDVTVHGLQDIDGLEARLRGLSGDLGTQLVWLRVSGALSLDERVEFDRRIRQGVGSALRVLRLDDAGLLSRPTQADLASIDYAGFVRAAADRLAALATSETDPQREIAALALQRLFVLASQGSGATRP